MTIQIDILQNALKTVIAPQQKKNIVELNYVETIDVQDQTVTVGLRLPGSMAAQKEVMVSLIQVAVKSVSGVSACVVNVSFSKQKSAIDPVSDGLRNVKHIVAVSSCKGGVGKSSTAVNVAFSLSKLGYKVGIFDADIYGPSLPTMVNPKDASIQTDGQYIFPLTYEGVKLMSFGFLNQDNNQGPAILRGPMVSQILNQLLTSTQWDDLDYLIIDYPPGTGDIQLTLGQTVTISAAVIVTTPQYISFIDVVKGVDMFDTLKVPTIAVVENMSYFICPNCDEKHRPFGEGAMKKLQKQFGFQNTFEVPITPEITHTSDDGIPFVLAHPDSSVSSVYSSLAKSIVDEVTILESGKATLPNIGYEPEHGILIKYEDRPGFAISPFELRRNCQCANCVEEFSGKKLLEDTKIPKNIYPLSMNPVGNYALGVHWSDNHASLYPYTFLDGFER